MKMWWMDEREGSTEPPQISLAWGCSSGTATQSVDQSCARCSDAAGEAATFVTGVEVGLAVSLQVAGDVGGAKHLPTDAAGHFAFVSDHV